MSRAGGGDQRGGPERQADREHEERGDVVDVHRVEDTVRHLMRSMGRPAAPEAGRSAMAFPRPGMRAPPPDVKRRVRPLLERVDVCRKAAARSIPTARSSARATTNGVSASFASWPWSRRSASSADAPLPLQILLEAAGAHRQVAGENRHAVFQNVHVGRLRGRC